MTTVAIHPDKKKIGKFSGTVKRVYVYDESKKSDMGYWTSKYTDFFWRRIFVTFVLLGLPVAFIWTTVWVLAGYAAYAIIPLVIASTNQKIDTRYSTVTSYGWYRKLRGGWADHGDVFYRQIWAHDCSGEEYGYNTYDYSYDDKGNRRRKDIPFHTACHYCDKRMVELKALYDSQMAVDTKTQDEVSETFFEASKEFRNSAEDVMHTKQSAMMQEISDQVKAGQIEKARPKPLKERLRRGS